MTFVKTKLVPLIFFSILAYGTFWLAREVVVSIFAQKSDVTVAILGGAAAIFASVLAAVVGKYLESRARILAEHREKKIPIYEQMIDFVFTRVIKGGSAGTPPSKEEIQQFMLDFAQRATVWASDEVIGSLVKWRRSTVELDHNDPYKIALLLEDVFFAMRKDLGHKNLHLGRGDLYTLFASDTHQFLASLKNKS